MRVRSSNTNSNGAHLDNINISSINFDSNQSELPKYEDLVHTESPNVALGNQEIQLNVMRTPSNTSFVTQENNNSIETDLNLPKYTELTP